MRTCRVKDNTSQLGARDQRRHAIQPGVGMASRVILLTDRLVPDFWIFSELSGVALADDFLPLSDEETLLSSIAKETSDDGTLRCFRMKLEGLVHWWLKCISGLRLRTRRFASSMIRGVKMFSVCQVGLPMGPEMPENVGTGRRPLGRP